jgi:hypothetical protein
LAFRSVCYGLLLAVLFIFEPDFLPKVWVIFTAANLVFGVSGFNQFFNWRNLISNIERDFCNSISYFTLSLCIYTPDSLSKKNLTLLLRQWKWKNSTHKLAFVQVIINIKIKRYFYLNVDLDSKKCTSNHTTNCCTIKLTLS